MKKCQIPVTYNKASDGKAQPLKVRSFSKVRISETLVDTNLPPKPVGMEGAFLGNIDYNTLVCSLGILFLLWLITAVVLSLPASFYTNQHRCTSLFRIYRGRGLWLLLNTSYFPASVNWVAQPRPAPAGIRINMSETKSNCSTKKSLSLRNIQLFWPHDFKWHFEKFLSIHSWGDK